VSALASYFLGHPLGGVLRGVADPAPAFCSYFTDRGVNAMRAALWAKDLAAPELLTDDHIPPQVGPHTLSAYQRTVLRTTGLYGWVENLGCGLGKTITTIAAAIAYRRRTGDNSRLWVVCPLNAIGAWMPYADESIHGFREFRIISMDSLHKVANAIRDEGGVIIYDEVHLLGVATARRTKAAHTARLAFGAGFCLTGTMHHGGIEKSLSMLDLALPGSAWFSNRWNCGSHFHCIVRKELGRRTVSSLVRPIGPNAKAFFDFVQRRATSMLATSEIVRREMQLPDQHIATIEIGDVNQPLEQIAAAWVHAHILAGNEMPDAMAVAHALAREGIEAKMGWLLDEMDDTPLVIFAGYNESIERAVQVLTEEQITYTVVDGSVTGADRIEAVRKFNAGEAQVFLGQIHAAGISTNLIEANVSICLDHNWSAADYSQALARTCRRGQTRTCYHFDLVTNVLQNRIVERLRQASDFDTQSAEYQALRMIAHDPMY
jgi:hypothetical protein